MEITDFSMTRGDTKLIDVSVTEISDGSATTISGATINWKATKSHRSSAVISKATGGSGIAITGTNTFRITLNAADTSSLTPGDYYHEAQVSFSDGEVATVLKGVMTLELGFI